MGHRFGESAILRFVVLHHTGIAQPHFDFMFETSEGSELATFRIDAWPLVAEQPATALGAHRRAYLDYQGPVSGGRGRVDRVESGRVRVEERDGGFILTYPDGRGFVALSRVSGEPDESETEWMISVIHPSSAHPR